MTVRLQDIRDCFEGVIPSVVATASRDGTPNVSYLSHVHYVDDSHVALSNQFFSKTASNVRENPRVSVLVVSARTGAQYVLDAVFTRTEERGELFERMDAHLKASRHPAGIGAVMALRSADIYRVIECRAVPTPVEHGAAPPAGGSDRLGPAARLCQRLAHLRSADPGELIDAVLDGLSDTFGIQHMMILAHDVDAGRLVTLASRGYPRSGIGSEVAFGEGVIGIAAERRRPVRIADMSREQRMAAAAHGHVGTDENTTRTVALPGLSDAQSQIAVPLVAQDELLGVLFAEARQRLAFSHEDEDALTVIAAQLSALLGLVEASQAEERGPVTNASAELLREQHPDTFEVTYFHADDSIFVDRNYIIKGLPGRLLWRFLTSYTNEGRQDFTNRELRLDTSLRLPDLKDNLETRLLLLMRRLDEKSAPIRLSRPARGRIRLDVRGAPVLRETENS